jgi:hypothetical protein
MITLVLVGLIVNKNDKVSSNTCGKPVRDAKAEALA